MKNLKMVSFLLAFFTLSVYAQTPADSIVIASASWQTSSPEKGIICKSATFEQLYGGPQSVCMVEVQPGYQWKATLAVPGSMQPTSKIAEDNKAVAAINGTYFNRKGRSVGFLKLGKEVIDTTATREFSIVINGAVLIKKGKVEITPWNLNTEKNFKGKKISVLASGPLLLQDGEVYGWNNLNQRFIEAKNPRTAIATTRDGKILLITVDGRFKEHSIGVNLHEFAHLIQVLGGEDALNVDGGGSTTLWCNGKVMNHPCDNRKYDHQGERKVPNILYIYK